MRRRWSHAGSPVAPSRIAPGTSAKSSQIDRPRAATDPSICQARRGHAHLEVDGETRFGVTHP